MRTPPELPLPLPPSREKVTQWVRGMTRDPRGSPYLTEAIERIIDDCYWRAQTVYAARYRASRRVTHERPYAEGMETFATPEAAR